MRRSTMHEPRRYARSAVSAVAFVTALLTALAIGLPPACAQPSQPEAIYHTRPVSTGPKASFFDGQVEWGSQGYTRERSSKNSVPISFFFPEEPSSSSTSSDPASPPPPESSSEVRAAPEPSSLLLLAVGVGLWWGARIRGGLLNRGGRGER